MSKNPKYDSARDRRNYTFHPGKQFQLTWEDQPGNCEVFFLTERQTAVLRKMVQVFPHYYWNWGIDGPMDEWTAAQKAEWEQIRDFVWELEAALVSGCDLQAWIDAQTEQTKAIRELTAVVGSLALDLTQPVPDNPDYTSTGLAAKFQTDNWIASDQNIADILANSLFGRYAGFPIPDPLNGEGLADILDDVLTILHGRFLLADFPTNKNMAEVMESLLRKTGIFDPEGQPNISDILDATLRIDNTSTLYGAILPAVLSWFTGSRDRNLEGQLQEAIAAALGDSEGERVDTVAEILLTMLALMQSGQGQTSRGGSLSDLISTLQNLDLATRVNVKNCNCTSDCDCGDTVYTNGGGTNGNTPLAIGEQETPV